jgi:hypothetical protein
MMNEARGSQIEAGRLRIKDESKSLIAILYLLSSILDLLTSTVFAQAPGRLEPAGLQGKKVTSLGVYGSLYAGTENDGVFRCSPFSNDTTWTPMGLEGRKILSIYPHKFGPIGFAVSAGVQPDRSHGDSVLVYCSYFDQTEWAVTDSGLNHRQVPWIKSLDGFPDPTICGETFAAGPGQVFRRYFLNPNWEEVLDIGLGITNVVRAEEYTAHVWAGGGTAIRMPWLARTKDKGATWEVSFPFFDFLTTCRSIAIHPSNSEIIYAGLEEAVIQTSDGGKNWKLTDLRVASTVFDAVVIDPVNPDHLLAGGGNTVGRDFIWELWESFDAGTQWQKVPSPPSPKPIGIAAITSIVVAPDTLGAFLIGTLGDGVWRYQSRTTTVEDENHSVPANFALEQNHPNPFYPETEIRYHLAWAQHVELTIFDVNGRRIVTLVEAMHPAGDYKTRWLGQNANGVQMPSGIYFCQLRVGRNSIATRKMTLLR